VPVVRLTEVFRQAAKSRIIVNAHRINHGQMPEWMQDPATAFSQ
jgi:exodeoxyribonuclease V alpha subunit